MQRNFLLTAERQKVSIATVFFCALFSVPLFALQESMGPGGSNVLAVHGLGYKGQNVRIGFLSAYNVYKDHNAFLEKDINGNPEDGTTRVSIDNIEGVSTVENDHDTQMAGIMISSGDLTEPDQLGAAPMAQLHNVRAATLEDENGDAYLYSPVLKELVENQNCKVIVTGFQLTGSPSIFNGNSITSLMYDYYAQKNNVVFCNAAGNYNSEYYRFYTPPTTPGDAYNGISTAGFINTSTQEVYDKVGRDTLTGPTYDNRLKPEIGAPSSNQRVPTTGGPSLWTTITHEIYGFTSWAVPHTGGVAAVLLSYAEDPSNTEPDDNRNEVIKAVIVNSAFPNILDKSGNSTVELLESEPDWPWNADRGYGRIDAMRAYEILSSPKITPSSTTANSKGWAYDAVSSGQQDNFTISGMKNERLVMTLTWNRRVEWNDQNSPMHPGHGIMEPGELTPTFADLDLEIDDPDDVPLIFNLSDNDNLEKVDLLLSKTGDYKIRVVYQSGSESANYGLAFERLKPLTADFDIDYVVNVNDLAEFVPYWLETDCTSEPCLDYDLDPDNQIDLSDYSIFAERWLDYDPRYYSP